MSATDTALGTPAAVVNRLDTELVRVLNAEARPAPKTVPHSFSFRPGIDLDKLGQLADELEAEAFAASEKKPRDSARRQRSRSCP